MFTVKATYRGQTRKITFPHSNSFPSFDQLCNQLYRVFPISQNYYLSKLLFSPDSTKPSRILIAKEVHSSDEYAQGLAPLLSQTWPNALLRFSVYEETPHKVPGASMMDWANWTPLSNNTTVDTYNESSIATIVGHGISLPAVEDQVPPVAPPPPPPPMSFCVPPPPIIYSSPPRAFTQAPMEVDSAPVPVVVPGSTSSQTPQTQHARLRTPQSCACVDGKKQVEALLTSFKADLDQILTNTFGSHSTPQGTLHSNLTFSQHQPSSSIPAAHPLPIPPVPVAPETQPWACLSHWCDTCMKRFSGPWYACSQCPIVQCTGCQVVFPNSHLICYNSLDNMHAFSKRTCTRCPVNDSPSHNSVLPSSGLIPPAPAFTSLPPLPFAPGLPYPPSSQHAVTLQTWYPPSSNSYHPIYTPAPPTASAFVPPTPSVASPRPAPDAPALPCVLPPATPPDTRLPDARTSLASEAAVSPVIHRGIVCDACDKTIEGIRHKCLDCPDYDLCTQCISSGSAERHNPFHEFFEISEPGRVIVHTVFSGEGERETMASAPRSTHREAVPQAPQASDNDALPSQSRLVVHSATCDLCDSRIRGVRFKCLDCPDFDTCSGCFSIVDVHHPHHSFVKITDPSQFVRRFPANVVRHYATCDICKKGINGIRYKCMHPHCPDFDLCQSCEAIPIPVHLANHPLLKMRSADTVIPTVFRVGQTNSIAPCAPEKNRSPMQTISQLSPSSYEPHVPNTNICPPRPSVSSSLFEIPSSRSPSPQSVSRSSIVCESPSPALSYRSYVSNAPPSTPPFVPTAYSPQRSPTLSIPGGFGSPRYNSIRLKQDLITTDMTGNIAGAHALDLFPPLAPISHSQSVVSVQSSEHADRPTTRASSPSPFQSPRVVSMNSGGASSATLDDTTSSQRQSSNEPVVVKMSGPIASSGYQTPDVEAPSGSSISSKTSASTSSNFKLPPLALDNGSDLFKEFWPRVAQEFNHLLTIHAESQGSSASTLPSECNISVLPGASMAESPFTGEALLSRPLPTTIQDESSSAINKPANALNSLAALLNVSAAAPRRAPSPIPSPPIPDEISCASPVVKLPDRKDSDVNSLAIHNTPSKAPETIRDPLNATFLEDVTVPDGQVFPPGAEFVKSWKILNDSSRAWPENTELVFVAGETLSRFPASPKPVAVGSVAPSTEVELSTGELKAPETPGRYVSYWRLRDADGNLFGNSIWIDITVQEHTSDSTPSAISPASSIIVPSKAQSTSPSVATGMQEGIPVTAPNLSTVPSFVSIPSSVEPSVATSNEEVSSDAGSVASSASLISIPSSSVVDFDEEDDDDEAVVWEDSRSHFSNERPPVNTANMEYVLLFDENVSEEEW